MNIFETMTKAYANITPGAFVTRKHICPLQMFHYQTGIIYDTPVVKRSMFFIRPPPSQLLLQESTEISDMDSPEI